MNAVRKLVQVLLILGGCLAICFAFVSIAMGVLFAQGVVAQDAILPLSGNLGLIGGGLVLMLVAKKWLAASASVKRPD